MTDGIIKSTGNSRYLKSVANILALYPTYEAFAEALAAGTFPIDLNGINPAGWETVGNKLDKATLLADATATGMGLTAAATPNTAFAKLRQLIQAAQTGVDNGPKIELVSYDGDNTYGGNINTWRSLIFSFVPKVVLFVGQVQKANGAFYYSISNTDRNSYILIPSLLKEYPTYSQGGFGGGSGTTFGSRSNSGNIIYWTSTGSPSAALNSADYTYYFIAFG